MAHYDLEEQEQIDSLKTWWKMYGNLATNLLAAVSVAALAWQGWNWYQRNQSAQAAGVYAVFEQAVQMHDLQKIKTASGELTAKFAATPYAPMAAMLAARQSVDAGDLKTAATQLAWVVEHGKNEVRDLARLRLAAVLLDDNNADGALKHLAEQPAESFLPAYLDLKGDVLSSQGKKAEALAAYQAALDKLGKKESVQGELLRQKIAGLGEAA